MTFFNEGVNPGTMPPPMGVMFASSTKECSKHEIPPTVSGPSIFSCGRHRRMPVDVLGSFISSTLSGCTVDRVGMLLIGRIHSTGLACSDAQLRSHRLSASCLLGNYPCCHSTRPIQSWPPSSYSVMSGVCPATCLYGNSAV
jgi:hypothetical protein